MKMLVLDKAELDLFCSVLPAFGEVYAPVRRGSGYAFARPERWSDVCISYPRTLLPPKKLLLPQREPLLGYDEDAGYWPLLEDAATARVLFGVHSYDIHGINILERVFAEGRYRDPYFVERRRHLVVVGVDFEPDAMHFAQSMNADFVDSGFDLFFCDLGARYLVLVGTSRGDDITQVSGCLLREPTAADFADYKRRSARRRRAYLTQVEIGDLPEIIEIERQSAVWEQLAARCLSCGACSMVCPTCYCFDVYDVTSLGRRAGERLRRWDSCLFCEHARVAGGVSFRASRTARLAFRYYHKQRGFVAEYGRPSCVGCGRCIAACPAEIDIVKVIGTLRGERDEKVERDTTAGAR